MPVNPLQTPPGADYGTVLGGNAGQPTEQQPLPSPNQPTPQVKATPTLGGNGLSSLIQQAIGSLDTTTTPEVAQSGTTLNKTAAQMFVPGYQRLSFNSAFLEPWNYNEKQMLSFQRSLAAAGYLKVNNKGEVNSDSPGFYDNQTRAAMEELLTESMVSGYNPRVLLQYRIQLAAGRHPQALKREMDPEEHKTELQDAYANVWKQPPPPNYLEQFANFNGKELEAYERAKATYQDSDVATGDQQQLLGMLSTLFGGK